MIIWILVGAVVLVASIFFFKDLKWSPGEAFFSALMVIFVGGILSLLIIGLLSYWLPARPEQDSVTVVPLSALNTKDSIEGHFFLGSGYVESKPVFSYIWEDSNNGFHLDWHETSSSVVYQNADSPTLTIRKWKAVPNEWLGITGVKYADTYEFRIPEGSILNNYQVQP